VKLSIEMSDELVSVDGVQCRIWNGHADNGVPVRVYVHRVAVPLGEPMKAFDEELLSKKPPERELSRRV
jgi:hypothetical protein